MSFPGHELEQSAKRPPLKALGSLLLFVVFCLLASLYVYAYTTDVPSPISPIGVNIRVANDAGDRLYMLALQPIARMVPATQRRSWTWKTFYYVEIWCTDATTMTPVWRRRVLKLQPNNPGERELIGVQGDVLWVYESGTLYGRALSDGAVVSDTAAIEAKNPQLAGLMPRERRYFGFDGRGLYVITADARHYRIDAETLEARQARAEDANAPPLDAVWAPPYSAPMSTGGFVSRGIDLGPSWLGLLTEEETKTFHGPGTFYGMGAQARYRLYQARSGRMARFQGHEIMEQEARGHGGILRGPAARRRGHAFGKRCCEIMAFIRHIAAGQEIRHHAKHRQQEQNRHPPSESVLSNAS